MHEAGWCVRSVVACSVRRVRRRRHDLAGGPRRGGADRRSVDASARAATWRRLSGGQTVDDIVRPRFSSTWSTSPSPISTCPAERCTRRSTTFRGHPLVPGRKARQAIRQPERRRHLELVAERRRADRQDLVPRQLAKRVCRAGRRVLRNRRPSTASGFTSQCSRRRRDRAHRRSRSSRRHAPWCLPIRGRPGCRDEALCGTHRLSASVTELDREPPGPPARGSRFETCG